MANESKMARKISGMSNSTYPSTQAPRGLGSTEIKAAVFREAAVVNATQAGKTPGGAKSVKWGGTKD